MGESTERLVLRSRECRNVQEGIVYRDFQATHRDYLGRMVVLAKRDTSIMSCDIAAATNMRITG